MGGQQSLVLRHIEAESIENGIRLPLESGLVLVAASLRTVAMIPGGGAVFARHIEIQGAIQELRKLVQSYDDWKASHA